MDRDRHGLVVGFVGPSGVGKTSLLEGLVAALRRRGLSVAAVKHASHGFAADRPGKDSHRLYEAGAEAVALLSREQVATFTRRAQDAGEEVSLEAALAALPRGFDVVLAEGFSWEPIPRVVLCRPQEEPAPQHLAAGEVLETAVPPPALDGGKPPWDPGWIEALADALAARSRRGRGRRVAQRGSTSR